MHSYVKIRDIVVSMRNVFTIRNRLVLSTLIVIARRILIVDAT